MSHVSNNRESRPDDKAAALQRKAAEPTSQFTVGADPLQRVADASSRHAEGYVLQRMASNGAGRELPDGLRSGVESLSGQSMAGVRVHYNSPAPAQLQALAYAKGNDIHLGPGQAKHLPHEAWHVAQQKQGRVKPTTSVGGQAVNDSGALEREADVMGGRAIQFKSAAVTLQPKESEPGGVIQAKTGNIKELGNVNALEEKTRTPITQSISSYNALPKGDEDHLGQVQLLKNIIAGAQPLYINAVTKVTKQKETLELTQANDETKKEGAKKALTKQQEAFNKLDAKAKKGDVAKDIQTKIQQLTKQVSTLDKAISDRKTTITEKENEAKQLTDTASDLLDNHTLEFNAVEHQMKPEQVAKYVASKKLTESSGRKVSKTTGRKGINRKLAAYAADTDYANSYTHLLSISTQVTKMRNQYLATLTKLQAKNQAAPSTKYQAGIDDYTNRIAELDELSGVITLAASKVTGPAMGTGGFESTGRMESLAEGADTFLEVAGGLSDFDDDDAKKVGNMFSEKDKVVNDEGEKEAPNIFSSTKSRAAIGLVGGVGGAMGELLSIRGTIQEWKDLNHAERAYLVTGHLVRLGEGAATIGEKANTIRTNSTDGGVTEQLGKYSNIFGGVGTAISGLRDAIVGFIAVYRAAAEYRQTGENLWEIPLLAGQTLAKMGSAVAQSVQSFYDAFGSVPGALAKSVPGLGIAMNIISIFRNIYNMYTSGKYIKMLRKESADMRISKADKKQAKATLSGAAYDEAYRAPLAKSLGIKYADLKLMTQKEKRGVLGGVGQSSFLRFSPYVMAKIDAWSAKGQNGPVKIPLGPNREVILTAEQARKILRYELVSKTEEINLKRQRKGGLDMAADFAGLAANISKLTGVGALPALIIDGSVAALQGTHTGAKLAQRAYRNKQAKKNLKAARKGGALKAGEGYESFKHQADYAKYFHSAGDESTAQKDREYRRHTRTLFDMMTDLPKVTTMSPRTDIEAAQAELGTIKKLFSAAGAEWRIISGASPIKEKFDHVVEALKSGR